MNKMTFSTTWIIAQVCLTLPPIFGTNAQHMPKGGEVSAQFAAQVHQIEQQVQQQREAEQQEASAHHVAQQSSRRYGG